MRHRHSDVTSIFDYDVFISYSHEDMSWVITELLPRLEAQRLRVCIDFRDFIGGAFSVEEMERTVLHSRRLIAILTPAYFLSEWTRFENIMAQTMDPGARSRRLIPVLLKRCTLPLRLRVINFVDLRSGTSEMWDKLVRSVVGP